jgi:hypothetical protein
MALILIAVGLIIAFLGRRVFWLFAALIGLGAGIAIVNAIAGVTGTVFALAIGIGLAIILALTARSLTRVAIMVIGFLLGAIIASELIMALTPAMASWLRLIIIVGGGILGWLALRYFFGPAVIIMSAIAGGILVEDGLSRLWTTAPEWLLWVVFAAVAIAGGIYQWNALRGVPEPH